MVVHGGDCAPVGVVSRKAPKLHAVASQFVLVLSETVLVLSETVLEFDRTFDSNAINAASGELEERVSFRCLRIETKGHKRKI